MGVVPTDPRCKIAFIGSHGVGKTTLAFGLAARLKARDISLEVALVHTRTDVKKWTVGAPIPVSTTGMTVPPRSTRAAPTAISS